MPSMEGATTWFNGSLESLEEQIKGKPVLVHFWAVSCGICKTKMPQLQEMMAQYGEPGLQTVAVHMPRYEADTDLDTVNEAMFENGIEGVSYPLASDVGGKLAAAYNILVEDANIALRGLFIINPEGVLQYSVVHDLNLGRSVDETLRVLQGLQTGGLCAADWTPGQENLTV